MSEKHKYETLKAYLKNEIASGNVGCQEKIPSENELAERFSLSRFTVRRSIELLVNEGLLEKRHGSGTFVRAAAGGREHTGTVGIITTYFDDYIFPSIIQGIENVLTGRGLAMSLAITGNKTEKESACLRTMLDSQVDGLIVEGTKTAFPNPNIQLFETFRARHIPIVFINGGYSDFKSACVLMDDEGSAMTATEYFIRCGHKRIGAIFKSDDIQGHRRYKGFVHACHARGLTLDEEAVLWYTTEDLRRLFAPGREELLYERFAGCTAILCYNDQIAVRMIEVMKRGGRDVPGSLSVIGFDNSDLCELSSPKLTSMSHARQEMGVAAAEMLMRALHSEGVGDGSAQLCLPSRLVVRDSVSVSAADKK